ncbi:MAG TPA: YbaB/EbfC family nucleoid-associated protein [Kiritimatiellia bacterium]|nr:YbaB/EbfC family nucleoid-associated protein [Kiritimatiellia bacterium]
MANFMKMMKQAADMQKNVAKTQEALAAIELEHSAGGGAVTVKITGDGNVAAIRIDPKVIQPGETEMLEDLILTAVRGAQELARETAAREMQKLTAGLNLPPGFGF